VVPRARFELSAAVDVPNAQLTTLPLTKQVGELPGVQADDGGVKFRIAGQFEVLLTVAWDRANREGHRFAHTALPDEHPLHSEEIEADVLADISEGRQLLRGNGLFGPDSVDRITLGAWQNSGTSVRVEHASLEIRPLPRRE
jgi:hypothetical protein